MDTQIEVIYKCNAPPVVWQTIENEAAKLTHVSQENHLSCGAIL